ncbi:MAG TPA: hypothetical protein VK458_11275 [Myxococcaceae bacterium]|nr:hypothetical protein [Myxococcaceae bacterium]
MKGLLRGLVAVGLLAGAGCRVEGNLSEDGHKSPIQEKYQANSSDEAQPLSDPRKTHPAREMDQEAGNLGGTHSLNEQREAPLGGGTSAPNDQPAYGGSGTTLEPLDGPAVGLADSYKVNPAQGGSGQQPQQQQNQAPQQDTEAPQQDFEAPQQ